MAKVVSVVPLYINHPSLYPVVERFFDSMRENYPEIPIIVCDDASPLEVPVYSPLQYRFDPNAGFTRNVNRGLEIAFQDHELALNPSAVIVMNDDLIIKAGDLDSFYALEGAMIASPMDTSASNDDRFGACWGITREAYDILGPLNEDYRHFYSDLDYYNRAKKSGVVIEKWYDVIIDHPESATYKHVDKERLLQQDKEAFYGTSDV